MKKALIIGISGQDGSLLANLLLSKGYEVHGSSRDAQLANFKNIKELKILDKVKIHSLSTNDFRSTITVIQKVAPDEIYNLAGQSSVGLSFEQPVETFESIALSNLNLLEAIRFLNLKTKIYSAGSSECFGNTPMEGANEKSLFQPRSPYAIAKATAFWQIANYREAYKLYACTGILFNHESQYRPSRFVTKKIIQSACNISKGLQDQLQLGNLNIQRDWGWAEDYVQAMWLMLQQEEAQDFVISTGVATKLETFVQLAFEALNLDWKKYVKVEKAFLRPTDIAYSKGDSSLAKNILGWQPTKNLKAIIKHLIEAELRNT